MTDYTQTDRLFKVKCEGHGADDFLLRSFSGVERVSEPFVYRLHLLSQTDHFDPKSILGREMTIEVEASGGSRYFSGIVTRFGPSGPPDPLASFEVEIVPKLWLLSLKRNSRIFQEMTAPKIVEDVLGKGDVDYTLKLSGTYPERTYCVQYNESDFNFVSRLLEDEGIHYYFEHKAGSHTLILSDQSPNAGPCKPQDDLKFGPAGAWQDEDVIINVQPLVAVHPGLVVLQDYDFENPATKLLEQAKTVSKLPDLDKYEVYDYPGEYLKSAEGRKRADRRMEEEESMEFTLRGNSNARSLQTGYKFTMSRHFAKDADGDYLVLEVRHQGRNPWPGESTETDGYYSNTFKAIPIKTALRPLRTTPRPVIPGSQTAEVVGPKTEEIYTDKYGRIKVQFHWDREGKMDEKSSCWMRVSTVSAGAKWGTVMIPRIGMEVVVTFLSGDPDKPVITGCLYNAAQMPPYGLPDNQTQSGIKTRSSKEGDDKTFNELRFEDLKDKEEIYLHAERDLTIQVENIENRTIDGHRVLLIKGNGKKTEGEISDMAKIEEGDQKLEISKGSQTLTLLKGDRKVELAKGSQTVKIFGDLKTTIKSGNVDTKVSKGNLYTKVSKGDVATKVSMGKMTVEAMQKLTLKVGGSQIELSPTGIKMKAVMIEIAGQAKADLKSPLTTVSADAMLTLKGALVKIN